jgi:aminoglycoside 6'-N-acetyltransferase
MPYHFRPFTRADVPMVALWLQTPEVVRWWGEPEAQLALIIEDLDEPSMRQWIVEHDGLPFAYVQAYRAQAWPQKSPLHARALARTMLAPPLPGTSGLAASKSVTKSCTPYGRRGRSNPPPSDVRIKTIPAGFRKECPGSARSKRRWTR